MYICGNIQESKEHAYRPRKVYLNLLYIPRNTTDTSVPTTLLTLGITLFPLTTDNLYFLHELPIDIFCPFLHEVIQLCLIDLGDLLKHYFKIAIFVLKC